jgi:CRP/FNR family transcriptional regulator, cyclic AMP receptor protein
MPNAPFLIPADVGTFTSLPDGGVIFIRGDAGNCLYVVRSGKVEIREGGRVVEVKGPGEMFGELALIDEGTRSASAVAIDATDLVAIDRDTFYRMVRDDPSFAIDVMREMAKRLRTINALQRPVEESPIAPKPALSA